MNYLVTSREMKELEDITIQKFHIPSLVLMEKAALSVVEEVIKLVSLNANIGIACGVGNNGADGLAVARILTQKGYRVECQVVGDLQKQTKEFTHQLQCCKAMELSITQETLNWESFDLVIDALFGIGLSRVIEGKYLELIQAINKLDCMKIAIDMPSGIQSDDGNVMGDAIKCDKTITFQLGKIGQFRYPGKAYANEVIVKDIGIIAEQKFFKKDISYALEEGDIWNHFHREPTYHKGNCGRVLIVAGNKSMSGACYLASKAAYVSGCGLVHILTAEENIGILHSLLPEAIVSGWEDITNQEMFYELVDGFDCVLVGPGLGKGKQQINFVKWLLEEENHPLVIDADGLNIVAEHMEWLRNTKKDVVVTPHIGEMSRLTGLASLFVKTQGYSLIKDFSNRYMVTCVLKDAVTMVAAPYEGVVINTTGTVGMATAGSGDVLAGILVSLMAQGIHVSDAAKIGVWIHGKAGEEAANVKGNYSMMASDLINGITETIRKGRP